MTHRLSNLEHEYATLADTYKATKAMQHDMEEKVNSLYQQIADGNTAHLDKLTLSQT